MVRPRIGPRANSPTVDNLPPPNTLRWSKRRKCELLAAIDAGLLSRSEACSKYRLSVDEVVAWRQALTRFGIEGLRARRPRIAPLSHAGIPLHWRLFSEIRRLAGLAQAGGAAAAAALLEKAAAELHMMDPSTQTKYVVEGHDHDQ
jgi:hypothetical protein